LKPEALFAAVIPGRKRGVMVELEREAGVLLHLTSLPGRYGCGDLGSVAYEFVDFLQRAEQRIWQVLPLVPTSAGNSPYTSYSAFAGNPLLISFDALIDQGLLRDRDVVPLAELPRPRVDFGAFRTASDRLLRSAFEEFLSSASPSDWVELDDFTARHQFWLEDYALFMALVGRYGHAEWNRWDSKLARREPAALSTARHQLSREIRREQFVQWQFFQQWDRLKHYAHRRGVQIFGDAPIFVAYESADVWQQQRLFHLDDQGTRTVVAGVPPDYFAATGQLWGNPLYRWDVMADDGYQWWINRLRHSLAQFDLVRLDHFRGFESYWEIPAGAATAVEGRWVPGPGSKLFQAVSDQLGPVPIVAEDLGLITQAVTDLRDEWRFPGMRVLQFGFDDDEGGQFHRPHSYSEHCVAYTGTHDNDTLVGWYHSQQGGPIARRLLHYLQSSGQDIHRDAMQAVAESRAALVVFPLQDVLGLGGDARMNVPGTCDGNWQWRVLADQLTDPLAQQLAALARSGNRSAAPSRVDVPV